MSSTWAVLIPTRSTTTTTAQATELPTLSLRMPHPADKNSNISNNNDLLALGRNGITKILNPQMSRRLAKVQWSVLDCQKGGPTLTVHAVKGAQGTTRVNQTLVGTTPQILQDGDVISLESPDETQYHYRLEIRAQDPPPSAGDMSTQETVAKLSSLSHVQSSNSADNRHAEHIQEFSCAICLEIMVEPVTAVPCGHSFCKECLAASVKECPTCCTNFQGRPFPSRSLNHAIELLVDLQPNLFANDDVQQYMSRTKRLAPPPGSTLPTASSRKRTRHVVPESSGKTISDAIVID